MGKLITGSFMFVAGLFLLATGVGALIGIPMFAGGIGLIAVGVGSLGKTAVKTGLATGKIIKEMRNNNEEQAYIEAKPSTSPSVADEIAKLAALLNAGHLTQAEFDQKKAQLLGLTA